MQQKKVTFKSLSLSTNLSLKLLKNFHSQQKIKISAPNGVLRKNGIISEPKEVCWKKFVQLTSNYAKWQLQLLATFADKRFSNFLKMQLFHKKGNASRLNKTFFAQLLKEFPSPESLTTICTLSSNNNVIKLFPSCITTCLREMFFCESIIRFNSFTELSTAMTSL